MRFGGRRMKKKKSRSRLVSYLHVGDASGLIGWSIRGVVCQGLGTGTGGAIDLTLNRAVAFKIQKGTELQILYVQSCSVGKEGKSGGRSRDAVGYATELEFNFGSQNYSELVWKHCMLLSEPVPAVLAEICGLGLQILSIEPPDENGASFLELENGYRLILHPTWLVMVYMPFEGGQGQDAGVAGWVSPWKVQ